MKLRNKAHHLYREVRVRDRKVSETAQGGMGILFLLLGLLGTGCLNSAGTGAVKKTGVKGVGVTQKTGETETASFSITQIRASQGVAQSYDVFSGNTGLLGKNCGVTSQNAKTQCNCVFSYTLGSEPGVVEVVPSYGEEDMIRCSTKGIPSGASEISVQIGHVPTSTRTNSLTIASASLGAQLDPTKVETFVQVRRYQCRQLFTTSHLTDASVYDPFQSEDLRHNFGKNFYSTNLASSYLLYSQYRDSNSNGISDFECPVFTNDERYPWVNLDIMSLKPDTQDCPECGTQYQYRIFDTDAKSTSSGPDKVAHSRRSLFMVAKQETGIFKIPVNAITAPNLLTRTNATGTTPLPLGYAAPASDDGCPSADSIPANMQWRKLWLFKLVGYRPKYVGWKGGVSPFSGMGSLICSMRKPNTSIPYYNYCSGSLSLEDDAVKNGTTLASRVTSFGGMCYDVKAQVGLHSTGRNPANAQSIIQNRGLSLQTDQWIPVPTNVDAGAGLYGDNTNINAWNSAQGSGNDLYTNTANKTQLESLAFTSNNFSYYVQTRTNIEDYLFITTPPEVKKSDLMYVSSIKNKYTPVRYVDKTKCPSKNPDDTTNANCRVGSPYRLDYSMQAYEIGDASATPLYPVCVIQPKTDAGEDDSFYE